MISMFLFQVCLGNNSDVDVVPRGIRRQMLGCVWFGNGRGVQDIIIGSVLQTRRAAEVLHQWAVDRVAADAGRRRSIDRAAAYAKPNDEMATGSTDDLLQASGDGRCS